MPKNNCVAPGVAQSHLLFSGRRLRLSISRAALARASLAFVAVWVIAFLYGCSDDKPAPVPTINPNAHLTATIRIAQNNPYIDGVKVVSEWELGNFKCAPIIMPEGYLNNPSVYVNEKVTRIGKKYEATVLLDRFTKDKCNWFIAGGAVDFMHKGKIYTTYGFVRDQIDNHGSESITCLPSSFSAGGVCVLDSHLNSKEQQTMHKFNATVEFLP